MTHNHLREHRAEQTYLTHTVFSYFGGGINYVVIHNAVRVKVRKNAETFGVSLRIHRIFSPVKTLMA